MFGATTFVAGFLLRPVVWPGQAQQETAAEPDAVVELPQQELNAEELAARGYISLETLKVRIDDGEIQWYDGTVWHTAATVEKMEKEDKFYVAEEDFQNFEEQMKQQLEDCRAEQESVGEQGETLLVGQKAEPKPTEKPKSDKPAVTTSVTVPVFVPEPTAPPENNVGGNPGGGDSGNSGNTGGGNTGGGNTSGGDSGNTGGDNTGGDSGNSGTDTGDGENMEWSDDYL